MKSFATSGPGFNVIKLFFTTDNLKKLDRVDVPHKFHKFRVIGFNLRNGVTDMLESSTILIYLIKTKLILG